MQGTEGVELCSHIPAMKLFALYVAAVFIYVPDCCGPTETNLKAPYLKRIPHVSQPLHDC